MELTDLIKELKSFEKKFNKRFDEIQREIIEIKSEIQMIIKNQEYTAFKFNLPLSKLPSAEDRYSISLEEYEKLLDKFFKKDSTKD